MKKGLAAIGIVTCLISIAPIACGDPSPVAVDDESVTLRVDGGSYAPGDSIEVRLHNGGESDIRTIIGRDQGIPVQVRRASGWAYVFVPGVPSFAIESTLQPGETLREIRAVTPSWDRGRYRFVLDVWVPALARFATTVMSNEFQIEP